MVVIMFSLIFYGFLKIPIIQQAAGIIVRYIGILVWKGVRTLASFKEFFIKAAIPSKADHGVNWVSKTVVQHVDASKPTLSPAETGSGM